MCDYGEVFELCSRERPMTPQAARVFALFNAFGPIRTLARLAVKSSRVLVTFVEKLADPAASATDSEMRVGLTLNPRLSPRART
jgi:hypothetical protein